MTFKSSRGRNLVQGNFDDVQLVAAARRGDNSALEFLLSKYRDFVCLKARSYYLIGAERQDLIQEGMIGLYKAIKSFRQSKRTSFHVFAELCITRQMISAIKMATRYKHLPLNAYVSLDRSLHHQGEADRMLIDVFPKDRVIDPQELVIGDQEFGLFKKNFGEMFSELEVRSLRFYLDGKSYQEIAERLNRPIKSIDNALQRAKRKVELYLKSRCSSIGRAADL